VIAYTKSIKIFFLSKLINGKIDSLKIENYKEKDKSRGKMKNRTIKLF
jgi:hypothetical protein